ncbi:hypothetical protein ACFWYW_25455 [Nonomuraea sp. NPDC059023]|uniref:hypothetical protein n=1 Tax=unclassified Nonomuraea TaxID=2593643 RepID=UPI0036818A3C
MPVDVGRRQLFASSSAHQQAAEHLSEGSPAAVLLFYGAECGLKAALLGRLNLRSTAQLPEHLRSHDLQKLAKELRLPPHLCARMQHCASHNMAKVKVEFRDLHQAWRYGHALRKEHEQEALAVLRDLLDWCQQELRA